MSAAFCSALKPPSLLRWAGAFLKPLIFINETLALKAGGRPGVDKWGGALVQLDLSVVRAPTPLGLTDPMSRLSPLYSRIPNLDNW